MFQFEGHEAGEFPFTLRQGSLFVSSGLQLTEGHLHHGESALLVYQFKGQSLPNPPQETPRIIFGQIAG